MSVINRRTDLQDLIETADRLSANLERIASNELAQYADLAHQFDVWAWETYKLGRDLKTVKEQIC